MFGKYLVSFIVAAYLLFCMIEAETMKSEETLLNWINVQDINLVDLEPAGLEDKYPDLRIYVARALHQTTDTGSNQVGLIPGKYIAKWGTFYYTHNGSWFETPNCEVLVYPRGSVSWIPIENVQSIDHVVIGGLDPSTNEILRICRFEHQKGSETHLLTGKLYPYGDCVGPFSGEEDNEFTKTSDYEVLVVNSYGKFFSKSNFINP